MAEIGNEKTIKITHESNPSITTHLTKIISAYESRLRYNKKEAPTGLKCTRIRNQLQSQWVINTKTLYQKRAY